MAGRVDSNRVDTGVHPYGIVGCTGMVVGADPRVRPQGMQFHTIRNLRRREGYNAAVTILHKPGGEGVVAGRGGCLRALVSAPALAVLAPLAALYRLWARRKRGSEVVVDSHTEVFERPEAGWTRVATTVDVPQSVDGGHLVTACVVRIAEGLGSGNEVFYLVHREPGREETIAVPLGSTINDLAEWLVLSCRRSILDGRTLVWPVQPRGRHLGEVIDPVAYDPEAPGEPENLLRTAPIAWALVLRRRSGAASTVFEMTFIVPEDHSEDVTAAVSRLAGQLQVHHFQVLRIASKDRPGNPAKAVGGIGQMKNDLSGAASAGWRPTESLDDRIGHRLGRVDQADPRSGDPGERGPQQWVVGASKNDRFNP